MYPEILRIGNFVISSFGLMVALAFLVGYWITSLEFKRKNMDQNLLGNLLIVSMIGGIGGAKIMYLFENVPFSELMSNPATHILSRGGLTFYGGFIGSVLLIWLLSIKSKVSFFKIVDACAPALAIGHSIGRVGCFLVGDDYGIKSDVPWAVAFPKGLPPTTDPVHPTQVYEVVFLGIIFFILWKLRKKSRPDGWLFSMFIILAGIERFLIEFIRNTTQSPIEGLSVAQLIAVGLIALGIIKVVSLKNKSATETAA
ncbi:MAG: prolipoprotein diacylglyceryl transferase [Candidatus Dadabacteria bacterium]|nr:prolipoprotein diacylglyceryl transferase [Candidatus Dadabacteria bacterium]NIS08933.1 prolipoprotein diacylglyceryl transferase [Candidatus Dadabacteria bacterium]NIV40835.1 prolipoprotein diacylglyceryl transferase [Candidatus Dadabacteria bacterium]NIX15483.1 prolipoprotein diacylglyceryl transferase [Candidatus Dadabacteria bacterium]NIY22804.1 prolipoprotein diacylglyceryl transferase [Candidatus Dadabacteria bacterium]